MGKESDLLKHVKNNDAEKVQKVLIPIRKGSLSPKNRKERELLERDRNRLLDLRWKERINHVNIDCHEEETGYTPLILAVLNGNRELAMQLIHFSADVNARDNKGNTALHVATFNGRSDMIELLLQCGAEVDTFNHDRNTPVHIACQNCIPGTKFILLKLLKAQPDLTAKNKDGTTPFDLAAQYSRVEAVALLLDHEPAFRSSSRAFVDACIRGHKDVVRLMLDYKFDPNTEDEHHGSCGLHEACRYLRHKVAELLVSHGADPDKFNSKGENSKTILASYPADKTDELLKMFEEWKGKPKLTPRFIEDDNKIANNDENHEIKALYPILKNDISWTKTHSAYCNAWMKSNPHTYLLDDNPSTLCVIPCKFSSFVIFDFGRPYVLSGIRIVGWNSDQMPKRCQLLKAEGLDGPWETVRIFTCLMKGSNDPLKPGESQEYHGFRETSQYWKLLIKDNHGGDIISFHGVHFYGVDTAVTEFFDQLEISYCTPAFIEKGFNRKEELTKITREVADELVADEEDRWKLLDAVGMERQIVSRLKRRSELDVMFLELQQMLHV